MSWFCHIIASYHTAADCGSHLEDSSILDLARMHHMGHLAGSLARQLHSHHRHCPVDQLLHLYHHQGKEEALVLAGDTGHSHSHRPALGLDYSLPLDSHPADIG